MARLVRKRDGEGFSGSRVEAWERKTGTLVGHTPMVGACLLVGSITAGTYSSRDFWVTTPITKITKTTEDSITFLTKNSEYTLYK